MGSRGAALAAGLGVLRTVGPVLWSLEMAGLRSLLAALLLTTAAGCGQGELTIEGRSFIATLPSGEQPGVWAPRFSETATLELHPGGRCNMSTALAEYIVGCGHMYQPPTAPQDGCSWQIERTSGGEALSVVFQGPKSLARVRFGGFRHPTHGDIALMSTCGSGDAWGLFKLQPRAS